MMKIGVQAYNFREAFAKDFKETLRKIATLGVDGLEFTSDITAFPPDEIAALLKELHLECAGIMFPANMICDPASKAYDYARALKSPALTYSCMSQDFKGEYQTILADIKKAGAAAAQNGFVFSYHNHWREFVDMDGLPVMIHFLKDTDPVQVFSEPDICWMTKGGTNPAEFVRKYSNRICQIHLKDISDLENYETTTELGRGVIDLKGVIAAAKEMACPWLIYEQDYSQDPLASAEISLKYLKDNLS